MNVRTRLAQALLWYCVIMFSIYIGGIVMSMIVLVPQWSESPDTLRKWFGDGRQYRAALNFVGPRWMLVRNLPLLALLVVAWPYARHRRLLIVATACSVVGIAYMLLYVYPINEIIMVQAGVGHDDEEVRSLIRRWVIADRLRLVVSGTQFLCTLIALSIPFPMRSEDPRRMTEFALAS